MLKTYRGTALALTAVIAVLMLTNAANAANATWRDSKTGLEWQRCSLGQVSNGLNCDNSSKKYTWDEAQSAVTQLGKCWRLPTAVELGGLVRCSNGFKDAEWKGPSSGSDNACRHGSSSPTIDSTVFRGTPNEFYWSSTLTENDSNRAVVAYFSNGGIYNSSKKYFSYVRAVCSR